MDYRIHTLQCRRQRSHLRRIAPRKFNLVGRQESRRALYVSHQAARSLAVLDQPRRKMPANIPRRASYQYHISPSRYSFLLLFCSLNNYRRPAYRIRACHITKKGVSLLTVF
jgi:hypothetical protein